MNKLNNQRGGFTLIELMIVVAIIGILAAIAIPNFLRFQLKAKSSEGKTNLAAIRTAEMSYYSEFGTFVAPALLRRAAVVGGRRVGRHVHAELGEVRLFGGPDGGEVGLALAGLGLQLEPKEVGDGDGRQDSDDGDDDHQLDERKAAASVVELLHGEPLFPVPVSRAPSLSEP